jgi:putative membrane protein
VGHRIPPRVQLCQTAPEMLERLCPPTFSRLILFGMKFREDRGQMQKSISFLFMLLVCGAMSFAQSTDSNSQTSNSSSNSADKQFMMKAAQGGQTEVAMGQLAEQKGASDAVKQLGQTLVTDHQTANSQLQQIASQEGAQLPSGPDAKDQAMADRMQNLSGEQFDRMFLNHAVMDHQKDIKEFQKEADSGSDPQVKQFAQQQLPVLKKHLQMAQQAQQSSGKSSSASQ